MNEKKLIALTGGIGSGKSTALNILKQAGFNTLSSDQIVSELYENIEIRKLLKELFPQAISGEQFDLDRKKIAEQTFSDKEKHLALTDLITPMVMAEIIKRTSDDKLYFVEVPLLFECEFADLFDAVMVVTREKEQRIDSVVKRSNMTREQVEARMLNQFDYDNNDLSSFIIIENNGSETQLKEKVLSIAKSF